MSPRPARPIRPEKSGNKPSSEKPARPARPEKSDAKPAAKRPARETAKAFGKKVAAGLPKGEKSDKPASIAMPARRFINVYLSLGSNMGNRRENLRTALARIEREIGKTARRSHFYDTQPWGVQNQDAYLNQVVMVNTMLEPRQLLEKITLIERELGRERREKWGPRPIDIDILFYGKRVIRDAGLEIPHPEIPGRAFVLVPLLEIAPDLEHPILGVPMDQLYMDCTDQSEVVQLEN